MNSNYKQTVLITGASSGENLIAHMQLVARNDEYEYTTRLQPAVAVFQKDLLHPRVPAFTGLKLIWRVQVQQGQRFDRAKHIERVVVGHQKT
ncbi:MAG: hypothetical protein HUU41_14070 [Bryobacteraceae bacterium]|nr:hypothetical protein [Bryobacterales bacterium]NUN02236.1 hypothetical protein [Bryobacteraceae bacterium]